jgi:hypothetical protein
LTISKFKQVPKPYCDDVQTLYNDISYLVKFDEVMQKFESTSGAILSRSKKSKVMGVGQRTLLSNLLMAKFQAWTEQEPFLSLLLGGPSQNSNHIVMMFKLCLMIVVTCSIWMK